MVDIPVQEEIKIAIRNAAEHFRMNGLSVAEAPIGNLQELVECGLAQFFTIQDIPLILRDVENPKKIHNVYLEMLKSMFGKSKYSFAGLFFSFLYETNGLIPKKKISKYVNMMKQYRQEFLVGFHCYAIPVQSSSLSISFFCFFFNSIENAWWGRCSILSNLSNNCSATQWFTFQTQWRGLHNDF